MRLNKRHQNGQAPKGKSRSVLMDVFPRGLGALLRCSFFFQQVVKWKDNSSSTCKAECAVYFLSRRNQISSCFTGCRGDKQQRRKCSSPEKSAWTGNTKITLIESSDGLSELIYSFFFVLKGFCLFCLKKKIRVFLIFMIRRNKSCKIL